MKVVLPVLATSFAALCIWLAVRVINRRERWAGWTLGLPLLYVVSFGPALWMTDLDDPWSPLTAAVFWPLGRAAVNAPALIRKPLAWYAGLFAHPYPGFTDWEVYCVPVGPEGKWNIISSELER
jgi:hypothetical protein